MTAPNHRADREFLRRLFGKPDDPIEPADLLSGNRVPSEGDNPEAGPTGDAEMREFIKDLFDKA